MDSVERDFEQAHEAARHMVALADAMRMLPTAERRKLVFQTLVFVESTNGERAAPKTTAERPSGAPTSTAIFGRRGKGKRVRRSADLLARQADALLAEIARKGDRRIEEIAANLGTKPKELAEPMKKLLAARLVTRSGVARGTKYTAKAGAESRGVVAPKSDKRASGAATRAPKGTRKSRTAKEGGPWGKIVSTLRAKPGLPLADLAKAVYGNAGKKSQHRLSAALAAMKGKRVRQIKGKRGAWEAVGR